MRADATHGLQDGDDDFIEVHRGGSYAVRIANRIKGEEQRMVTTTGVNHDNNNNNHDDDNK